MPPGASTLGTSWGGGGGKCRKESRWGLQSPFASGLVSGGTTKPSATPLFIGFAALLAESKGFSSLCARERRSFGAAGHTYAIATEGG